jgi:hypothetical protein
MTDGATILCQKCGFTNVRGDQFCGSCGAFLEWQEGSGTTGPAATPAGPVSGTGGSAGPAGPSARQAAPAPPSSPAVAASPAQAIGGPASASGAPTATPASWSAAPPAGSAGTPSTPSRSAAPGPDPEEDLVRCPACGIANPVTRTFCQSCGTTLAAAQRIAEPPRDVIAAAVASSSAPTTPVPSSATRPVSAQRPASRGIPGWVFVVALAGILVGVGIVVVAPLIAGPGPDSGATSGPTGAASVVPSVGPSSTTPGGSGAQSTPAPQAVKLVLTGATASSVVGDRAKFQPQMAIDGDLATSWQEGSANEAGQWIEATFDASRADTLVIRNGYQASTALYKGNLRLKDIEVSIDGGPPIAARLKDTTKAQRIDLGQVSGATTVRITIKSTYASVKTAINGTPFDDAAVSEISVLGVPGG